ncbi:hypothetical protein LCL95_10040 [Bacillus timonensis]|nr:hypothetical protein [Bacillus timonensis]
MKKITILLVFVCFSFLFSACSQNGEETKEYIGVIVEGSSLGYEYSFIREPNSFIWKIGYNGEVTTFEETTDKKDELGEFMYNVNESTSHLTNIIIQVIYLSIVAGITIFLYRKSRKTLKDGGAVVIILAGSYAFYTGFNAAIDLFSTLHELENLYYFLTS